uniref:Uncharacterized protein n=1 Tax=Strigamia maritima TaxID=126957 RepID=T1JGB5_STRMM
MFLNALWNVNWSAANNDAVCTKPSWGHIMGENRKTLIKTYFQLGLGYSEIFMQHLKRILHNLQFFRKKYFTDTVEVAVFIQNEIKNSGQLHEYRWMHLKCIQEEFVVSQVTVRQLLSILDPEGRFGDAVALQRRRYFYFSKGPNFLWHFDGYDKLKPYRICISSNPKVIGGYFINVVKELNGTAFMIRADNGTENGHVEAFQKKFHLNSDRSGSSCIYGKSTSKPKD